MAGPPDLTPPPPEVQTRLRQLSDLLDHSIPAKQLDRNLLIATWNLRAFGGLTKKWVSGAADSPKRNLADICYIAAVASRFDAMAVQEVRGNLPDGTPSSQGDGVPALPPVGWRLTRYAGPRPARVRANHMTTKFRG